MLFSTSFSSKFKCESMDNYSVRVLYQNSNWQRELPLTTLSTNQHLVNQEQQWVLRLSNLALCNSVIRARSCSVICPWRACINSLHVLLAELNLVLLETSGVLIVSYEINRQQCPLVWYNNLCCKNLLINWSKLLYWDHSHDLTQLTCPLDQP